MINEKENWRNKFSDDENGGHRDGYRPQGNNYERQGSYGRPMRPRTNRFNNNYNGQDGNQSREGGYQSRPRYNREGGYQPREGYQQREGGYQPRPRYNREGGYQSREGYQQREGGYQSRPHYNREGAYYSLEKFRIFIDFKSREIIRLHWSGQRESNPSLKLGRLG